MLELLLTLDNNFLFEFSIYFPQKQAEAARQSDLLKKINE